MFTNGQNEYMLLSNITSSYLVTDRDNAHVLGNSSASNCEMLWSVSGIMDI